jgi:SagB-type dehydrogenase family enzyme
MFKRICLIVSLISFALPLSAEELKQIKLSAPQLNSGKSLMQALKDRQSTRSFSLKQISIDVLSNLLWAANGINRDRTGKRTAPSAMNWQEIDIYVATTEGLYLYNPKEHALKLILNKDIRSLTGIQPFVRDAPVNLIYVADLSKTGNTTAEEKILFASADTGFISQNVYLYCASAGLATVVRGSIDKDALAKAMNLRDNQKIILAQTVGYPKE